MEPSGTIEFSQVHDESQIAERRYLSEASVAKLYEIDNDKEELTKEMLAS